jgi:thiamine-monophosphate kinase
VKRGLLNTPADPTRERRLVAAIRTRAGADPSWLPVGIGDDAAVAVPERGALEVFTTDAVIEGVHFDRRFSTPADVGWKALAVNLSDIAAMGATPRLALLSIALPEAGAEAELHALLDGFLALASEARVALAGGNLSRSPGPLIVDVTLVGFVRPRRVLRRGGARPGDQIYVSGSVGTASAGLAYLREVRGEGAPLNDSDGGTALAGQMETPVARHTRPVPRVRLGMLIGRNRAASACMDLSDGLADGVRQICAASGVGAVIDAAAVPIDPGARRWFERQDGDAVRGAIAGGDDYELVFTVPRRSRGRLATVIRQAPGVPVTRIGEVTKDPEVVLMRDGRAEPWPEGFTHF